MKKNISAKTILLVAVSALLLGLVIGIFVLPNSAKAEGTNKQLIIKTSAQCEMCQDRIQKNMKKVKGIENAVLNLDTKDLTITYTIGKITPDEIREALNNIGYDADNKPADPKAYKKLPKCCKKPDNK